MGVGKVENMDVLTFAYLMPTISKFFYILINFLQCSRP